MIRSRPRLGVPPCARVLAVLACSALAACAPAPVLAPAPAPPPAPPGAPVLGVAVIEPTSDVADLTEAMRHVIHPSADVGVGAVTFSPPPSLPDSPTAPTRPAEARVEDGAEPQLERAPATPVALAEPGEADVAVADVPVQDPPGAPPEVAEGEPDRPVEDEQGEARAPGIDAVGPVPGEASQTAILAAWERYCTSADLSPEQWGIIDRTAMPASLAAQWAARCRPEK